MHAVPAFPPGPFAPLARAHGFEPLELEGRLPDGLEGLLARVGPGTTEAWGTPHRHLFDGDGAVLAVRLAGGRAEGLARFVDTETRRAEAAAGRALHKRFGTAGRGRHRLGRHVGNLANTNVVPWQGRWLARYEGAAPTELDAALETVGPTDLGGVLRGPLSAHPHRVAARRVTYDFGLSYGRRSQLDLYAMPDEGPAAHLATIPLRDAPMVHDFAVSGRWAVFLTIPYLTRPLEILLGRAPADTFRWRPERGGEVICVSLDDPERVVRFPWRGNWWWHVANAFDDGDDVLVDLPLYPDARSMDWLQSRFRTRPEPDRLSRFVRLRISPESRTVEPVLEHAWPVEFPRVDPRVEGAPHRLVWAAEHHRASARGDGLQDALVAVEPESGRLERWHAGDGASVSEPVFVPGGAGEGEGWLLAFVHEAGAERSSLVVLDAAQLPAGPVARAWFDHPLPISFHGAFLPAGSVVGPVGGGGRLA